MVNHNKNILDEWNDCLSKYSKIKFKEARKIYIELSNCNDEHLKSKLKNDLILNTLYVVFEFIKNNGLIYLNSSSYDMSDIISTCNEIWINKINSGALLNVSNFGEMFDSEFYNKLSEELNITKLAIGENTVLNINSFVDLLMDYIELKRKNPDLSINKFIEYLKNSKKYTNILQRIYYYGNNFAFCKLFDAIIESFELSDADLNISKTKLEKLKYIIISNGLEYLRENINLVICMDSTNLWLDEYCRNQIVKIIFEGDRLNDIQKDIIAKRFGIIDGRCKSLDEVAADYNVTRERIRQREVKALRMLRYPTYFKKLKELM